MCVELATCNKCGKVLGGRDYINGRYQWYCESCHKVVKAVWKEPQVTPMQSEPYEPLDGAEVKINIDAFQERLNHIG
jgi:hypothetical protein